MGSNTMTQKFKTALTKSPVVNHKNIEISTEKGYFSLHIMGSLVQPINWSNFYAMLVLNNSRGDIQHIANIKCSKNGKDINLNLENHQTRFSKGKIQPIADLVKHMLENVEEFD